MTKSQRKLLDDVRATQDDIRQYDFDGATLDIMLRAAQSKRRSNPRDRDAMIMHMALKGLITQMTGAA